MAALLASVTLAGAAGVSTAVAGGAGPALGPALGPTKVTYGPAPDMFAAGAELAVLQGNPDVAGAEFTVRLRTPNGYVFKPHWHPVDENVTVIAGKLKVGLGDVYDESAFLPTLHRGGFITAPAGVHHFAKTVGQTVLQVHGIGPFAMTYVNPADDPRNQP